MLGCNVARVHARALGIVHDRHERTDLIDREIELPTATDERQTPNVVVAVHALTARLSKSSWQQPDLFVVPNRRNGRARLLCQLANLQLAHKASNSWPLNLKLLEGLHCHKTFGEPTELQQMETDNRAPIACSLQPGDYRKRLVWIAELARDGLLDVSRDDLRLELRYAPHVADRVREMVAQEKSCCAFLDFDVAETDAGVRLTITAPERARDVADALFEQFAPVGVSLSSERPSR
jgi:hypothetical protein